MIPQPLSSPLFPYTTLFRSLYPAIDLKEGRCVRLIQGDMDQATVFNDDPADQAATFEAQGFEWLHVVELDGAFAGKPMKIGRAHRLNSSHVEISYAVFCLKK